VKMIVKISCLAALCLVPLAGCGSNWQNYTEEFRGSGIVGKDAKDVPAWVTGDPQEGLVPDEIAFVGRSIGFNVLDERAAYNSARDHVLQQVAAQVATWIGARAGEADRRWFDPKSGWTLICTSKPQNRFLPGEQANQALCSAARACTQALVGDLVDRGTYWEQWYLEENPERHRPNELRMTRYKCWLRMSIKRQDLESRIQTTLKALRIDAGQPGLAFEVVGEHKTPAPSRLDPFGAAQLR